MPDEPAKTDFSPEQIKKLYIRGCFTNSIPWLILYPVAAKLDLGLYVAIAAGMQYAVYIFHGLPYRSEKFYDLSGSATHFAVVAAALVLNSGGRSPR